MSKNIILFSILSLCLLALESSLSSMLFPSKYFPDLAVILISYISLNFAQNTAITASFMLGLIQDLSSGIYLGPNSLGAILSSSCIKSLSKNLFSEQILSTGILIFIASLIKTTTSFLLIYLFDRSGTSDFLSSLDFVYKAISSGLVGSLVFFLLGRSSKKHKS